MKVSLHGWMSVVLSGVMALVLSGNRAQANEFGSRHEGLAASTATQEVAVSTGSLAAPQDQGPAVSESVNSTENGRSAFGGEPEEARWRFRYVYRYHYYYPPVYYYRPVYYWYGGTYYYWVAAGQNQDGTDSAKPSDQAAAPNR